MFKKAIKTVVFIFTFVSLLIPNPKETKAENQFNVDINAHYDVYGDGKTMVKLEIYLENATDDLYATAYTLNLASMNPKKTKSIYKGKELVVYKNIVNENNYLQINFSDFVIGKGKGRHFDVFFEEDNFAQKSGEVWELSIPRLSSSELFREYSVTLSVPNYFGSLSYINPDADYIYEEKERIFYRFTSKQIATSGISLGFGKFQVFDFELKYHLQNDSSSEKVEKIAIPPDTLYQKMFYQKMDPVPQLIEVDNDGNWLAEYRLKPNQKLDIEVQGSVQIYSSARNIPTFFKNNLNKNTIPSKYWQSDDPKIVNLAKRLKSPKSIYEYVFNYLNYDYESVEPTQRLGALEALEKPYSSRCMEFTDLFIAITRASGIPAREINGYAYTENPEIEPLSLVADVLHSWPEYWDEKSGVWIPIDPTWASTTGGVDYFEKLDLRHFAFVIHGESPTEPNAPGTYKLGTNPQKDIYVTFGKLAKEQDENLIIMAKSKRLLPFLDTKISVVIKNESPSAIYNIKPKSIFNNTVQQESYIEILPPFSEFNMEVFVPTSIFSNNSPDEVKIIAKESELLIPTGKKQSILLNLVSIFLILISAVLLLLKKAGKIPTIKLSKIREVFK